MIPNTSPIPAVVLATFGWLFALPNVNADEAMEIAEANKHRIEESFHRWRAGTGGPFDLLDPAATWTIAGTSLVAKKYETREAFLDSVIKPFNARLEKPLVPTIRRLYSDGDTVVAHFEGEAVAHNGTVYRNTYAWFMRMEEGKIVEVTAFFDSKTFDKFWKEVPERE